MHSLTKLVPDSSRTFSAYSLTIRYARDVNIVTLCYPSHTTHVLQGLDVVAFGILKCRWHTAHDHWETKHWPQKLSKAEFIEVFGTVFLKTMTPELMKECF